MVGDPSVMTVGTRGSKIKSIGAAPRRSTPAPVKTRSTRASMHLESIMIPPAPAVQPGMMEVVREGGSLESVYGQSVLRDSEVLAIEAGTRARTVRRVL
jgi:hypothetical protein